MMNEVISLRKQIADVTDAQFELADKIVDHWAELGLVLTGDGDAAIDTFVLDDEVVFRCAVAAACAPDLRQLWGDLDQAQAQRGWANTDDRLRLALRLLGEASLTDEQRIKLEEITTGLLLPEDHAVQPTMSE